MLSFIFDIPQKEFSWLGKERMFPTRVREGVVTANPLPLQEGCQLGSLLATMVASIVHDASSIASSNACMEVALESSFKLNRST